MGNSGLEIWSGNLVWKSGLDGWIEREKERLTTYTNVIILVAFTGPQCRFGYDVGVSGDSTRVGGFLERGADVGCSAAL